MRIVDSLPCPVHEIENVWIRMSDGCRLAARLWLPDHAPRDPVPAILEYIPYGKRGGTRSRDEPMHRYFAGHGYAAIRVDLRGAGDSEGLLLDEYLDQELADGVEVLRWIAAQPWCSGRVGMIGKSWGGFNALQIACRQPESLGAIIAVCAADDRYADDAHYMGGCLLNENLVWGSGLFTLSATPPDPELAGEGWRAMWRERLDSTPLFPRIWLDHPWRDEYWRRGSVNEEYGLILCPVFAVSGWADAYTNAVPRLLAGLECPRRGLIGPWAHQYPHEGVPGPAIGFLQEALRWWDHWLKGIDTGMMEEPMYRVWMQESVAPRSFYAVRPGRWVAEDGWPSSRIQPLRFRLLETGLADEASTSREPVRDITFVSPQTVGLCSGSWCSFGNQGELPTDQRQDDGRSMTFDSPPLEERLEILGAPVLDLAVAVDRPLAFLAVRLNDVAPDGASTRVTYALLNLTHRESSRMPQPLVPGIPFQVVVKLNDVAHAFHAGHRIRVAISSTYWPLVWPSPKPVMLTLSTVRSCLELPVRPSRSEDHALRAFGTAEGARPPEVVGLDAGGVTRKFERDLVTGDVMYQVRQDDEGPEGVSRERIEAIDLELGESIVEVYRIREDDPLSACVRIEHRAVMARGPLRTRVDTVIEQTGSLENLRLQAELRAYEGDQLFWARSWDGTVPRRLF